MEACEKNDVFSTEQAVVKGIVFLAFVQVLLDVEKNNCFYQSFVELLAQFPVLPNTLPFLD